MRFSCPACTTSFEVADANLDAGEALEVDCPGCASVLLLAPAANGDWTLAQTVDPLVPVATEAAAKPHAIVPEPSFPVAAQPRADAPATVATPAASTALPPGTGSSASRRKMSDIHLQLPDPHMRKAPPSAAQMWQDFSVMFRLDQKEKGRRTLVAWSLLVLVLLGGIGALVGVKVSQDLGQRMLGDMHADLAVFTLPYQSTDADRSAPGTVLSRKLAVMHSMAHPPKPVALPEPVTAEAAPAVSPPQALAPAVAGVPVVNDLKQRLENACTSNMAAMAACSRRFMVPRPLRVRFIVNAAGHPESVRAAGGGDQHDAFQNCLARVLRPVALGPQELELRFTCTVP
jgi:predicted Zn finger-like uncharacterized protein